MAVQGQLRVNQSRWFLYHCKHACNFLLVNRTVSWCFRMLQQLHSVWQHVLTTVFQTLVVPLVLSQLDYCNGMLIGLRANLIQRLRFKMLQHGWSLESAGQNTSRTCSPVFTGFVSLSASSLESPYLIIKLWMAVRLHICRWRSTSPFPFT